MKLAGTAQDHGLAQNAIDRILDILADYPEIKRITLFGSRAKGLQRPTDKHRSEPAISDNSAPAAQVDGRRFFRFRFFVILFYVVASLS